MPGIIERPMELRSYEYDVCCGATSTSVDELPEVYTIPEENIPPVHNQYDVGACGAFAMCQCAESNDLCNGEELIHYSPSWNYGRVESRGSRRTDGLIISTALKGAKTIGFISERLFPNFNKEVPEILDICAERDDIIPESSKKKIISYASMNYAMKEKKWNTIRQALYDNKRAILITSSNFFRGGGHAIIAIGWSNTNGKQKGRYLEFQNSWGEDYKNNGRYFIPIDYVSEAYSIFWNDITMPFTDVVSDVWYYDYIKSVYLSGLVQGVTATEFKPEDNIIRGDLAIIVDRALNKLKYSLNTFIKSQNQLEKGYKEINFEDSIDGFGFKDVDSKAYYAEAVNRVFANGIITGDENNLFNPENDITRAEMSAILVRMYLLILSKISENIHSINVGEDSINMNKIKDVGKDDWFYGYVEEAYKLGLMNGVSEDTFAPMDKLTRAESAAIFSRLFKSIDHLLDEI